MLEKIRNTLDNKGACALLLTDLSKAFDCIRHNLIAKLHSYGFDGNALQLMFSYMSNRRQRTKINSTYSTYANVRHGIPQGSILGPLLFNIYINDMFYFIRNIDIANFADDTSPYACDIDTDAALTRLKEESEILFIWFENNYFKSNPDKSHLLAGNNDTLEINIGEVSIKNSSEEKLLGITISNDFSIIKHVSNICKKASKKLHALARISHYMSLQKRRNVMKAFVESEFGYCPLIWTFHGNRSLNNCMNKLHERALRLVYRDYGSTYESLLLKDGSSMIHHRNLQILATEIYKFNHRLSAPIMHEILDIKTTHHYNLRHKSLYNPGNVNTVYNGTETIRYHVPKTWDMVPDRIKKLQICVCIQEKNKILDSYKLHLPTI